LRAARSPTSFFYVSLFFAAQMPKLAGDDEAEAEKKKSIDESTLNRPTWYSKIKAAQWWCDLL